MQTYHKTCNGEAFVDVSDLFSIETRLENFDPRNKKVTVGGLRIDIVKKEKQEFTFTCSKCKERNLHISSIIGSCGLCGRKFLLQNLQYSSKHGVVICTNVECVTKLGSNPRLENLLDVLKNISL